MGMFKEKLIKTIWFCTLVGSFLFCPTRWCAAWELPPPQCVFPSSPPPGVTAYLAVRGQGAKRTLQLLQANADNVVAALESVNWIFVHIPCSQGQNSVGVMPVRVVRDTCSQCSYDRSVVNLYRKGYFFNDIQNISNEIFEGKVSYEEYKKYYNDYESNPRVVLPNNDLRKFLWCYAPRSKYCLAEPTLRKQIFTYEEGSAALVKATSMFRFQCNGGTWVSFWFGGDPVNKMKKVMLHINVVIGDERIDEVDIQIVQQHPEGCN